ncbi:phosphoribosylanthranilate isomerase [Marinimicrobium alkaliphilum]|uniref:phosphoribosylanthranilate isomerase n=1 Tax=Marinimicrobium alkaliphilum TaxID=2202654 RepID=UPI000DB92470|nr:phosphoribosylanthranilate isomerase [Marinimicrobium alkaliphilum]
MRVKICGITSVADARTAVNAGADAIGLVFYASSPRRVDLEQARSIALAVGPLVTTVGLFVNAEADFIEQVLARVPLNLLQFHGDETPEACARWQRPYLKALRMRPGLDVGAEVARYAGASGILLDAYRPGVPGGTGESFDWQRFPREAERPLVLAGGLTPGNVAQAVAQTHARAVDVSGGVESAPGRKDPDKVYAFIAQAKQIN